jgi:SAM-dependent methyltransferase
MRCHDRVAVLKNKTRKENKPMTSTKNCEICSEPNLLPLWVKDGESYQRCPSCGLVRIFPPPSAERLEKIYQDDYKQLWNEVEQIYRPLKKKLNTRVLTSVLRWVRGGGAICDIGAATGLLMETGAEMGFDVYGVEGGELGAGAIRKKFGEDRLFYGWLEQIDFAALGKLNYFDAVTMVDVLEHSADPNVMLEIVHRILKDGGVVACYVPTTSSLTAAILKKRWDFYCTPHLFAFSNNNLRTLFSHHGFDILAIRPYPRYLSIEYACAVIKHVLKEGIGAALLPVLRYVPAFLARIVIPIYCGQVLVIARKRHDNTYELVT